MKPVNTGGHSAYQDRVLTQLRKYYPNAATSLSSSTWQILDKFWNLDLSQVDVLMQDRYSVFGSEPRLPSDKNLTNAVHPPKKKPQKPKGKEEKNPPDCDIGWDSHRNRYYFGYDLYMLTASDSENDLPVFPFLSPASRHSKLEMRQTTGLQR